MSDRTEWMIYGANGYTGHLVAAEARRRGWAMRSLPGEHLHQVVDPDATARTLLELALPGRP